MKLILQNNDNSTVEIREIESLDKNSEMLFFFLNTRLCETDIKKIENDLSNKIGKKVIVLDILFKEKILGI